MDMRDAPWSVSGWGWWDGGGVDQGLAELGKERVVLWPRVAKGGQGQQRGETVGSSPA